MGPESPGFRLSDLPVCFLPISESISFYRGCTVTERPDRLISIRFRSTADRLLFDYLFGFLKFKYFFRQDLQDSFDFCAFSEERHKPNRPAVEGLIPLKADRGCSGSSGT